MKKTRLLGAVCAFAIGIAATHVVLASPVTLTSNYVNSLAIDLSPINNIDTSTSIPYSNTLPAVSGSSSNTTNINYSGDTNYALFSYDFSHSIDNTVGNTSSINVARSINNPLQFVATSNAPYTIDGYYIMTGPARVDTRLNVHLYDLTASSYLFRDDSWSNVSVNESFVLGVGGDGDRFNLTTGSLSGNLIAGHEYQFFFDAWIQSYYSGFVPQVAATAIGEVNLMVGTVPVPAAVWLFGSGLVGLLGIARRKRTA